MSHASPPPLPTPLRGIVPPMVTPLTDHGDLDIPALERIVNRVITGGVHALFILGTTGEAASLTDAMRRDVITQACSITAGRLPILVGITDPCVADSLSLARFAADAGASAVVVSAPYYVPPAQDELESWVRHIAAQQPLPIFLYNIPILTKTAYAPDTVARLADLDPIVGIKDSSGDLQNLLAIRGRVARADFSFLIGAEALLGQAVLAGCHGCVGGGSMIDPALLVEIYTAASQGHRDRVAQLQQRIITLGQIYDTCGPRPAGVIRGIKTALACLGLCTPTLASPFRPATPTERERVAAILNELSIE